MCLHFLCICHFLSCNSDNSSINYWIGGMIKFHIDLKTKFQIKFQAKKIHGRCSCRKCFYWIDDHVWVIEFNVDDFYCNWSTVSLYKKLSLLFIISYNSTASMYYIWGDFPKCYVSCDIFKNLQHLLIYKLSVSCIYWTSKIYNNIAELENKKITSYVCLHKRKATAVLQWILL